MIKYLYSDTSGITKEVLHILINISTTKEGLVRMLDLDVLRNIFEVYSGTNDGTYICIYI